MAPTLTPPTTAGFATHRNGLVEAALRGQGWDVQSGLLFGGEFLISRSNDQGHVHSQFIVHVAESMTYQKLLGSLRVAKAVRKKVLLAAEDPSGNIVLAAVEDE